jgi:hypothetical protein
LIPFKAAGNIFVENLIAASGWAEYPMAPEGIQGLSLWWKSGELIRQEFWDEEGFNSHDSSANSNSNGMQHSWTHLLYHLHPGQTAFQRFRRRSRQIVWKSTNKHDQTAGSRHKQWEVIAFIISRDEKPDNHFKHNPLICMARLGGAIQPGVESLFDFTIF